MSSYLEKLRSTLQERLTAALGVAVSVRMTKNTAYGNFTANMVTEDVPGLLTACRNAIAGLPVARVEFASPAFLNFYLEAGWQQEALRQILKNAPLQPSSSPTPSPSQTGCFEDFEVQYVYSRICNQLELLASLGYTMPPIEAARLDLLTADCEMRLMEQLAMEPDLPQIAAHFHLFFNNSPIRGAAREIAGARIALVQACKQIFESVLRESFPDT